MAERQTGSLGSSPQWVTVDGLSKYRIREDGEVVSLWASEPKILKGGTDKDGYRKFVLIDDNGVRRYVRRANIVCTAFHGPRPEGMTVRHRDGSRQNDSKDNLSWATHSVNCLDKLEHGTAQRGARNGNVTISEGTARRIKSLSHLSAKEVAGQVGVKKHIVDNIRSGNSWGWV
ncbi:MAG: hypothetical protein CPSOU_1823 [uncultured Paraburkholderia sp.]|nr:MAG: hypothetical protein CPSOU_1823 [uncultured Paraburkholderia sp.]